jgi:hypothetical protein
VSLLAFLGGPVHGSLHHFLLTHGLGHTAHPVAALILGTVAGLFGGILVLLGPAAYREQAGRYERNQERRRTQDEVANSLRGITFEVECRDGIVETRTLDREAAHDWYLRHVCDRKNVGTDRIKFRITGRPGREGEIRP